MDYQELYEAMARDLPDDCRFNVSVGTWRYHSNGESYYKTEWVIYVSGDVNPGPFYRGVSADSAYEAFTASRKPPETLQETSAAVKGRPKPTLDELNDAVADLVNGRLNLDHTTVANLAMELTEDLGIELEIGENLLFWGSRNGPGASFPYNHWLKGCVAGKSAEQISVAFSEDPIEEIA
jgi:hypothetical protein